MNKNTAVKRYNDLSNLHNKISREMSELRAIIDAPEKPGSLLPIGDPRMSQIAVWIPYAHSEFADKYAWIKAFEAFVALRRQPGSEAPVEGKCQWTCDDTCFLETGCNWNSTNLKLPLLIPCFDTQANYQYAIRAIGAERILQMMKTFQGVE